MDPKLDSKTSPTRVWFENSSTLDRAEYDSDMQTLDIWFQNDSARYQYVGVPPEVFHALVGAESPGRTFHALIRSKFEVLKLR